jgi:transposase-like protein
MTTRAESPAPPFCPNDACEFHRGPTTSWRWVRAGFFARRSEPCRIQRYRCGHCGRYFSEQTFRTSYWLRSPELLAETFHALTHCTGFRQLARKHGCSPQTVLRHALRLGRHCLLFHEQLRPKGEPTEPLALDGFRTFEGSQYHPSEFHHVVGQRSHYAHGFTHSELRRSGTMTARQRARRALLDVDGTMAEADLARKWPELDHQARHAAITASSTIGMHGTDAERSLLQDVLAAMDKARRDKDAAELERQMRLAQRLSNAAFNRTPEAWEWYFEDAASEISKCRDLPAAQRLVTEGKAAITRSDNAELRRVVKALWQLLPESSEARKKGFDSGVR